MALALAMVLAAGLTVPRIGPEKVSAETTESLHLDGEWEGTFRHSLNPVDLIRITFAGGEFDSGSIIILEGKIRDEGGGRFQMVGGTGDLLGIYKHEDDRLVLCYREADKGRPTSFRAGVDQNLLILRRVKPRQ